MIAETILNALSVLVRWVPVRIVTIHSYEQGVRWWCGRDTRLIRDAGVYLHLAWFGNITTDGCRPKEVETQPQCVTTSDNNSRTFSVGCQFEISDLRLNQTCVDDFEASLLNLIERIAAKVMRNEDIANPDAAILTRVRSQTKKWGVQINYLGLINDTMSKPLHHYGIEFPMPLEAE